MSDDLLKIHCTTTVTIRNTRKNKIYANETESEMANVVLKKDTTIDDIDKQNDKYFIVVGE